MSNRRFANIIMVVFSKWWLLTPFLSIVGAVMALSLEPGDTLWVRIAVGSVWGCGLGLLSIPLSLPRTNRIRAGLLSALVVASVVAVTGVLLAWSPGNTVLACFAGAALGIVARLWAPYLTLV
jgi:hypothetical protein